MIVSVWVIAVRAGRFGWARLSIVISLALDRYPETQERTHESPAQH